MPQLMLEARHGDTDFCLTLKPVFNLRFVYGQAKDCQNTHAATSGFITIVLLSNCEGDTGDRTQI